MLNKELGPNLLFYKENKISWDFYSWTPLLLGKYTLILFSSLLPKSWPAMDRFLSSWNNLVVAASVNQWNPTYYI